MVMSMVVCVVSCVVVPLVLCMRRQHVTMYCLVSCVFVFFFQAEDGIRDLVRSRGLGDVYKRQAQSGQQRGGARARAVAADGLEAVVEVCECRTVVRLSLIHI